MLTSASRLGISASWKIPILIGQGSASSSLLQARSLQLFDVSQLISKARQLSSKSGRALTSRTFADIQQRKGKRKAGEAQGKNLAWPSYKSDVIQEQIIVNACDMAISPYNALMLGKGPFKLCL